MLRPKHPGRRERLLAFVAALVVSFAWFPDVWFGGRSSYSTEAMLGHEPWRSELGVRTRPHNPELGDQDLYFFPQYVWAVRRLHEDGRPPLWNADVFAGAPACGNVQVPVLSPFTIALEAWQTPGRPVDPFGVARGLSFLAILRFVVCLAAGYLWLRHLPAAPPAAAVGALALAAGPYAALWRHSTPEAVFSWAPCVLWGVEECLRARRAGRRGSGGALSVALASACMHLGGYPQTSLLMAALGLLWAWARATPGRRWCESRPLWVASAAGLLLVAPVWFPFFGYLAQGRVGALRRAEGLLPPRARGLAVGMLAWTTAASLLTVWTAWAVTARLRSRALRALLRGVGAGAALGLAALGGGDGQALLWLFPTLAPRPWLGAGGAGGVPYLEAVQDAVGVGHALLVLAAGARLVRRWRALAALLLLGGGAFPLFWIGLRFALPLLEPSRLAAPAMLLLPALAVFAGEKLARDGARAGALRAAAAAVLGFLAAGLAFPGLRWDGPGALGPGAAAGAAALVLALAGRRLGRFVPLGLLALGTGQLVAAGFGARASVPRARCCPASPFLTRLRAAAGRARVLVADWGPLPGNSPLAYGLRPLLAYDGIEPARFAALVSYLPRAGPALPRPRWRWDRLVLDGPLLDLLGAEVVVAGAGARWPAHFVPLAAAPLAAARNPRALPEAWLCSRAYDLAADPRRFLREDPRLAVGLSGPPPAGFTGRGAGAQPPGRILARRIEAEHWRLEVRLERPGWLVLRLPPDPDWQTRVDGRPRARRPAFHAFSTLPLAPGRHRIVLSYRPRLLRLGLAAAALGCLLCLGLPFLAGRPPGAVPGGAGRG